MVDAGSWAGSGGLTGRTEKTRPNTLECPQDSGVPMTASTDEVKCVWDTRCFSGELFLAIQRGVSVCQHLCQLKGGKVHARCLSVKLDLTSQDLQHAYIQEPLAGLVYTITIKLPHSEKNCSLGWKKSYIQWWHEVDKLCLLFSLRHKVGWLKD